MADHPEDFLDDCEWMGVPMQAAPVTMKRFKSLFTEQAMILNGLDNEFRHEDYVRGKN